MSPVRRILALGVVSLASGLALSAQSLSEASRLRGVPEPAAKRSVRSELNQLMRAEAAAIVKFDGKEDAVPPPQPAVEVAVLEPLVVMEEKPAPVLPPPEPALTKFVRTGTLLQRVGEKTTMRLWMKGDRGIMLDFSR